MARKASDLLDVFRLRPERAGGEPPPKKPKTRSAAKRSAKSGGTKKSRGSSAGTGSARARRAGDEVVSLSRRQLVYAGSVVVLLLALSFTFGVSMGGDSAPDTNPSLRRDAAPAWYIDGFMPKDAILTQQPVNIQVAAQQLLSRVGVQPELLKATGFPDRYRLRIGPFPSREAAYDYSVRYSLADFAYAGLAPFSLPRFVEVPANR